MFLRFTLGSLYLVAQHRRDIFKGIVLPLVMLLFLQLVNYGAAYGAAAIGSISIGAFLGLFFLVAEMAIAAVVSINTIRLVFLNEKPEVFRPKFGEREIKYLLYSFGFLALWMVPGLFISASMGLVRDNVLLGIIPLSFSLVTLFFTLRLALIFVGVAVGSSVSLKDSWRMTSDDQWALFFSITTMLALIFSVQYALEFALGLIGAEVANLVSFLLITPLVSVFTYVFSAIVLTILYTDSCQPDVSPEP